MLNSKEEKELINEYFFDDIIKVRGQKYYEENKVCYVQKVENDYDYYALVEGSNNNFYEVYINGFDYYSSCACPYPDECKHIYAVLLAIKNQKYELIRTKYPTHAKIDMNEIIQKIPAHKLKEALLNKRDMFNIDINKFKMEFRNYFPKEKYTHYYNRLYNCVITKQDYETLVLDYISNIQKYIDFGEYLDAFKIIKSIFEVERDLKNESFSEDLSFLKDTLNKLLKDVRKKSNKEIKSQIDKWIKNNN